MNAQTPARRPLWRRIFRLRNALIVVVAAAIVYMLLPSRIRDVVTVDQMYRWAEADAPPRWEVVWQPAEQFKIETPGLDTSDSLIRPLLAQRGTALYFTRRTADGNHDVYRSDLKEGAWQAAEPVEQLNTESNEVGPVIRPDGKRLYLYSDRPGGFGGRDLYVADKTPDGWSTPRNLGPRINTPADEYDPAISKDGLRLFFASNQTDEMHRRTVDGTAAKPSDQWDLTLRAEQGLATFDLYMARRPASDKAWSTAEPLTELNMPRVNEGAPFVSPSGAFLYFVSKRPVRDGEQPNFDIYRARIQDDRVFEPQNLGNGVNTAANEIEPALDDNGFSLLFSRNLPVDPERPKQEVRYRLYLSHAKEVFREEGWQQSRLAGLLAFLQDNWWWIVAGLLAAALLAALIWYIREMSLRRMPVPGVVLTALLLHVLIGTALYHVPLPEGFVEQVKKKFAEILVVAQLVDEPPPESREKPMEDYERVADLNSIETVDPADVARKVTETPGITIPTDSPIPELPTRPRRDLPDERLDVEPPKAEFDADDPALQRRRQVIGRVMDDHIELDKPQAVEKPAEEHARADVDLPNRQMTTELPDAPKIPRRAVDPAIMLQQDHIAPEKATDEPIKTDIPQQPDLTRTVRPTEPATAPTQVTIEKLGAPVAPPQTQAAPARTDVHVDQRQPTPSSLAHLPNLRHARPLDTNVQVTPADESIERLSQVPVRPDAVDRESKPLQRTERTVDAIAGDASVAEVKTESLGAPVADAQNDSPPARTAVNVSRQQPGMQLAALPNSLQRTSNTTSRVGPTVEQIKAQRIDSRPGGVTIAPLSDAPMAARRNGPAATIGVDTSEQVETVEVGPPGVETTATGPLPQGVRVDVGRQSTAKVPLPQTLTLNVGRTARTDALPGLDRPGDRPAESAVPATFSTAKVTAQLERVKRSLEAPATEAIAGETPAAVAVDGAASETAADRVAGVVVGVDRPDAKMFHVPVKTSGRLGGRYLARAERPVFGSLDKQAVDVAPTFSRHASLIARRPTRVSAILYADDAVGLQAMFRMRGTASLAAGGTVSKAELIEKYGGDKDTLKAVARGLAWLKKHQADDGRWSLHEYFNREQGKNYGRTGSVHSDTAATGLALLPFLGDGHTHASGDHQATVRKAVEWLVRQQREDGDLTQNDRSNSQMYAHGIATIALCEAYGMSRDAKLRAPAQRAIDFIVAAQHKPSGGWRYHPNNAADTSVVGWQVMAMKSGQMAGLNVPQPTLDLVPKWLDQAQQGTGRYRYQASGNATPTMTAEALLCLQYLGADQNDPRLTAGTAYMLENLPGKGGGDDNSYYWYYGTQVMFHLQGDRWQKWNAALSQMLIQTQEKDGHLSGTWEPKDKWEGSGGRVYSTALRLLMLEVHYRHLPLYQLFGM
ncbi:MAG: PD40 domain-containing protein [Candidatus Nealsonbacteria bacterium]|nr:PD40 domain-containing protein [Candidatus Nealsonbacteria bacterium]